ncbi:MAG TPA: SPOR domain-containing protein, partial [Erythrobacter sp.]|nr:SPOR domain-containing protein [Erythrobacter sp.]
MISTRRLAAATVLLALAVQGAPALAQREIVQPLPGAGEQKLSDALSRLARNSQDVTALLDAGEAALELDDIDAAIGFFGRANELSPGNPRTSVGLARAYTRSHRPIEALRLFAEAERAGVPDTRMAQDRGLAFDLVGDAASAQQLYRLALDNGAGAETVRRLALSQAISGDREAFEATLLPLLRDGDVPAFRTRAFG